MPTTTTVEKEVIRIELPTFKRFQYLAKLEAMKAQFDNRITAEKFAIMSQSSNTIELNKSKTVHKLIYTEPLTPAEYIYGQTLAGNIIVASNPQSVDLDKLAKEFPLAFIACLRTQGRHLRLNVKV